MGFIQSLAPVVYDLKLYLLFRKAYTDISLPEMNSLREQPDCIIVDVREPWEFEEFNEGGVNIPLSTIRENRKRLDSFRKIIVICTNGTRSKVAAMDYCRVAEWAEKDIYHVKGGILEVE
jgi:rhodanese-related sulfurtransferase